MHRVLRWPSRVDLLNHTRQYLGLMSKQITDMLHKSIVFNGVGQCAGITSWFQIFWTWDLWGRIRVATRASRPGQVGHDQTPSFGRQGPQLSHISILFSSISQISLSSKRCSPQLHHVVSSLAWHHIQILGMESILMLTD